MEMIKENLDRIVEQVFLSTFELPVVPDLERQAIDINPFSEDLRCSIRVMGGQNLKIVTDIPKSLIKKLAPFFFACEPKDVSEQDILDTMTELTNMLGGNIKALFDQELSLGLPVLETSEEQVEENHKERFFRHYDCANEKFCIDVVSH